MTALIILGCGIGAGVDEKISVIWGILVSSTWVVTSGEIPTN